MVGRHYHHMMRESSGRAADLHQRCGLTGVMEPAIRCISVPLSAESGAVQEVLRTLDLGPLATTDLMLRSHTLDMAHRALRLLS